MLVNPLLRSIPNETLPSLLGATRVAVTALRTKRDSHGAMANRSCYREEKENSGVILITNFRSLFIQRTSSASFGTQDLLFGQIELAHYEFARLQRVRPAGVGQIVSRQFQGAVFSRRYQVDAVSTVERVSLIVPASASPLLRFFLPKIVMRLGSTLTSSSCGSKPVTLARTVIRSSDSDIAIETGASNSDSACRHSSKS